MKVKKVKNIDYRTLLLYNLNNGVYGKRLLWNKRGKSFKLKVKNSTHSSWTEEDHRIFTDWDVMQGTEYPKTTKEFSASRRRWFANLNKIAKSNSFIKPYKYYDLKEPCSSEVRPLPKEINQTSLIVLPTTVQYPVLINPTPPNKDTPIYAIMYSPTSLLMQMPWGNKDPNQEENSSLQNEFMVLSKSNDSSAINNDVMLSGQDSLTESVELDRIGQYQVKIETADIKENDHLCGQDQTMCFDTSLKLISKDDLDDHKYDNRINENMNIDPNFNTDISDNYAKLSRDNIRNEEQAADIDFNYLNWMSMVQFKFPANVKNEEHTITAGTDLGLDLMSTAQDQTIGYPTINLDFFGSDFNPANPSEGMKEQLDYPKQNNRNDFQIMEETELHNLNEDSLFFTLDNENRYNSLLTEKKEAEFLLQDEKFINDLLSKMN